MEIVGQTVTVTRYTLDRYGDRVPGETFTVQHAVFAPRSLVSATSTEEGGRSAQVHRQAELYLPPNSGLHPSDVVTLEDGSTWEVDGASEWWQSPFAGRWQPGDMVLLSRTTG